MNYGTCLRCKIGIRYKGIDLCDDCRSYYFNLIKDYLKDDRSLSNNIDISRALNIPLKVVNYFIKYGDLVDISSDYAKNLQYLNLMALKELGKQIKQNEENIYANARMQFMDSIKRR